MPVDIKPEDILNNALGNLSSESVKWVASGILAALITRRKPLLNWMKRALGSFVFSNDRSRLRLQIDRYRDFNHEEELEAQSAAIRYAMYGFLLAGLGAFISLPLDIAILVRFGEAIILDTVANLKPAFHGHLNDVPSWIFRSWAFVIGAVFGGSMLFFGQAAEAAHTLSAQYRKQIVSSLDARMAKLKREPGQPELIDG